MLVSSMAQARQTRRLLRLPQGNDMFYALSWLLVFGLFALWSLTAWGFHAIATWTLAQAGGLTGGTGLPEVLRLPDWLAPWVTPDIAETLMAMLSALGPFTETLLGWMPAISGGLSVAVWVVWAIGSGLLVVLGLFLTAGIAWLRRRSPGESPRSMAAPALR
jgi:hypothetical protein